MNIKLSSYLENPCDYQQWSYGDYRNHKLATSFSANLSQCKNLQLAHFLPVATQKGYPLSQITSSLPHDKSGLSYKVHYNLELRIGLPENYYLVLFPITVSDVWQGSEYAYAKYIHENNIFVKYLALKVTVPLRYWQRKMHCYV